MHIASVRSSVRRFLPTAIVAIVAVAVLLPVAPANAATPPETGNPAKADAGWLAREFTDQQRITLTFEGSSGDFPRETAESVLAFDAAGVAQNYARNATAWLSQPTELRELVPSGNQGDPVFGLALLTIVATAQGLDPTNFGGVNLVKGLRDSLSPSGEFVSPGERPDLAGADQAIAIIALHRRGHVPASAVSFLLQHQCADGSFPADLNSTSCEPDIQSTLIDIEAIEAVGHHRAALNSSLDWLQTQQRATGGFGVMGPDSPRTAEAIPVLRAGGRRVVADQALAFLKSLQVGCSGAPADRGGVAENSRGGVTSGTTVDSLEDIDNNVQTVLGLAGVDMNTVRAHGARQAPVLRCASSA